MDGLWLECGPFRLQPGKNGKAWSKIALSPHSWHKAPAYTLYIDQPVGTGLVFTTSGQYPKNDEELNRDFYYFLTQFMTLHADKFLTIKEEDTTAVVRRPFYFSGESHAGHYIPSMMNYIRKQNEAILSHPDRYQEPPQQPVIIPLSGALIGNGYVVAWRDGGIV